MVHMFIQKKYNVFLGDVLEATESGDDCLNICECEFSIQAPHRIKNDENRTTDELTYPSIKRILFWTSELSPSEVIKDVLSAVSYSTLRSIYCCGICVFVFSVD